MRLLTTARITTVWAALFALVHFYWAAGGAAGMNGDPATTAAEQAYIGFIALLGMVGAAVAASFQRSRAAAPRRRVVLLARLGGGALLAGVVLGAGRWLAAGDLGDDGAAGVVITAYFLIGGILFSALGRLGARAATTPARATRRRAAAA